MISTFPKLQILLKYLLILKFYRVFGIRLGTNLYMLLTLLGQVIFASGAVFNLFWFMLIGRFIFG